MIVTVIAVGGLIGSIATAALYLAFRAFGDETRSDRKPVTLIVSLVAFLFACCALLFWTSRMR